LQVETARRSLVAVADVGEEGLGNLRGARVTLNAAESLGAVLVLDGSPRPNHPCCGGFLNAGDYFVPCGPRTFVRSLGLPSAITDWAESSRLVADLDVPRAETTFNVGVIEEVGTSVNTIAARASALLICARQM